MDYSFEETKFVVVAAPRGAQVLEVGVGTNLSTIHPVSEYETRVDAETYAKSIDPSWQPEPQGIPL